MARHPARLLTGAVLLLLLNACYFSGDSRVLVTSTPPGGTIDVDGIDTGWTTPHMLELDGFIGDDHEITIHKDGFDPEVRTVFHYTHWYTSKWIDGTDFRLFAFPLWWTLGDFFTPIATQWKYVPHELHVKLYPEGQSPVSAEPTEDPTAEPTVEPVEQAEPTAEPTAEPPAEPSAEPTVVPNTPPKAPAGPTIDS